MPSLTIVDATLKQGTVQTDALGLPFGRTGSFAITFKIINASKSFALRCFLSDRPTIHRRYEAISAYLQNNPLPYLVDFNYENSGLRIKGETYPILRMQWVDGVPLGLYVQEHHRDAQRMKQLQDRIVTMAQDLEAAGIAHGDLQGGNILVDSTGAITLVDYDGMFVPALASLGAIETGHPNFQHPQREQTQLFTDKADRFPLAVIYTALSAIQEDPEIWNTLAGDEEALLFRSQDFHAPNQSTAFRALQQLPQTSDLADRLAQTATSSIELVPSLDDFIAGRNIPQGTPLPSQQPTTQQTNTDVPWYRATERFGVPQSNLAQPSNAQRVSDVSPAAQATKSGPISTPSFPLPGTKPKHAWFSEAKGALLIFLFLLVASLIVVILAFLADSSHASVETCVKPAGGNERCFDGLTWTYSGCWAGESDDPPPVLQEMKAGIWTTIYPNESYAAHDGCQSDFPWRVEISHEASGVGTEQFRILFPGTKDFVETYEDIRVVVREIS